MRNLTEQIYPFYSVQELATLMGYKLTQTRKVLLEKLKVPGTKIGNKWIFYLTDIKTCAPALFDSILEANHLNRLLTPLNQEASEETEDLDSPSLQQFLGR